MEQEKITTTNLNLSPNTPIPVASIATPARQFTTLPPAPVVAPATPIIQPESEVKIQEDIKTITPKVDESYKNLLNAMGMTENQGARILEAEKEAGIPTLNKELTDVENEIRQKSLQFRREREAITTTPGLTTSQASARLADVSRKQNSELADLEVVRASRSNSLANIQNAISRKFELQFADENRRIDNLKTIYGDVKSSLTKAEDRQYDAMIKKEQRALDKEKEEAQRIYNLLETAAKNTAPRDVLLGISNAKTYKEALQIGARFLTDPLDRAIKQAQLRKLTIENNGITEEIETAVLPNGKVDVVTEVSEVLKRAGKDVPNAGNAIGVLASLQKLATQNKEGEFVGIAPIKVAGRLRGSEAREERIANRGDIEAINLKVQQWASGAALTNKQTKQVERLTPDKNDTDFAIRTKINKLTEFMQQQVKSELATKGVNYTPTKIDYFSEETVVNPEEEYLNIVNDTLLQVNPYQEAGYNL